MIIKKKKKKYFHNGLFCPQLLLFAPKAVFIMKRVVYFPLKALAGVSVVFLMYRKFNTLSAFASQ